MSQSDRPFQFQHSSAEIDVLQHHPAAAVRTGDDIAHETWPWALQWFKPTNQRRDLVKAAALLLAEIERLDRAAGG